MSRPTREEEFVAFATARRGRLRAIAYALCGDWHRAEDLTQTALERLYVAWPRVHRDGREEAYARRIIVNADLDERRRAGRRREVVTDDLPEPHGGDVATRSAHGAAEERPALVEALLALPPMQRRVVVLRHWLDLSVGETAAELGISEGTVKSHASRGLAALGLALDGHALGS